VKTLYFSFGIAMVRLDIRIRFSNADVKYEFTFSSNINDANGTISEEHGNTTVSRALSVLPNSK